MATFTSTGLNKLLDGGDASFTYLGVGNGTPSSTALGGELDRSACVTSIIDNILYLEALFTNSEANDDELSEWALFDASTAGNVLVYGTESPTIAKTSSSGLLVTIAVTLTNA